MSDRTPGADRTWYEIRLHGRLGARWADRFDGMTLTTDEDGTSLLRGPLADQAALHGVLRRLGDLGIPLLSLRQRDHTPPSVTPTDQGD